MNPQSALREFDLEWQALLNADFLLRDWEMHGRQMKRWLKTTLTQMYNEGRRAEREWVEKEVIGEDDKDWFTYNKSRVTDHIAQARNKLRQAQRQKLKGGE